MSLLIVHPRKWFDPVARAAQNRVKLLGDIMQKYCPVVYLVAYERGLSSKTENIEYFYQFNIKAKFIYYLSDVNILFLWKLRKCVNKYKPCCIWFSQPYGIISTKILFPNLSIVYLSHDVLNDTVEITGPAIRKLFSPLHLLPSTLIKVGMKSFFLFIDKLSCAFSDFILTQSESDRQRFLEIYKLPSKKVITIPCPIDQVIESNLEKSNLQHNRIRVVFHGNYSYPPNKEAVDFIVQHLAPSIEKSNPEIYFVMAGANMPKIEGPNFELIGFVDDLNSFLRSADMAVIPITKGTGLRTKALDYMVAGVPMITTKVGVGGIELKDGVHAIIVKNLKKDLVQAIISLSHDEFKRKELARNAWQFVMKTYSNAAIDEKLRFIHCTSV
jgi:glycosyltransferase involved in cell wall biosynthesis